MAGRDSIRLVAALLLGAVIAFPLGMIVAGKGGYSTGTRGANPAADAPARQVFAPSITSDPYFLARQREGIELLERQCRDSGDYCSEAAQGRRWLTEQQAGR